MQRDRPIYHLDFRVHCGKRLRERFGAAIGQDEDMGTSRQGHRNLRLVAQLTFIQDRQMSAHIC